MQASNIEQPLPVAQAQVYPPMDVDMSRSGVSVRTVNINGSTGTQIGIIGNSKQGNPLYFSW